MIPLVLVADSDPFALLLLEEACRGAGCEVMTALDGAQVLDLIARQPPSLLILDAALPRVDGEEVARILASDDALQAIPLLVAGPEGDLGKPYRVTEIQERVEAMLREAREARRRARESSPPVPLGTRDEATGAGTRSQLLLSLEYELTLAARFGRPLSCLLVLADEEAALPAMAEGLMGALRAVDPVFRFGERELVALLPDTDTEGMEVVERRVRERLGATPACVGGATAPVDAQEPMALLALARGRCEE
ncbi:MAG TPA: response regulator [Polyangiaceae bacterium LLY-WYZ-15_(1-7)]|nr:hypothetical protein [Myxococcales bacterium]MAT27583.1 hypothetical protein [Sandaracinus sp.]HJL05326.1 response regulator [Polyangiaceae bacterium LLY-WYZ-15_(1-7)]HJL07944.1 response regulator [Polyangiaceae bacterium LLY-WYZ-15_(1-7)]HJL23830.1 response regulator [Polyangiaceae bacterium LLY-WYZ-15_(1-7)]